MKRFTLLSIVLLASVPMGARASFDLILQYDEPTLGNGEIDRYDPVSRAYLGSFRIAGGLSAASSMVASSATGELYIRSQSTGNTIDVYNYSTGAYLRQLRVATGKLALSRDGLSIRIIEGNSLYSVNPKTAVQTLVVTLAQSIPIGSAYVMSPSGRMIVADDSTTRFRSYNTNGTLASSLLYSGGVTTVDQLALRTPPVGIGNVNNDFLGKTNLTNSVSGVEESSLGALSAESRSLSAYSSITGVLEAHAGMYFIGTQTASPTVLKCAPMTAGAVIGPTFDLSQTTLLTGHSTIVLAPEPGTMVALAAGVGVLARRRRSKR